MGARGIHHLGIAVDDLDEAVETYERLFGAELEQRGSVDDQGVEAAALRVGNGRVELLAQLLEMDVALGYTAPPEPFRAHVRRDGRGRAPRPS